jgi:polysaccharide biosynthesis protein PslG
LGASIRSYTLMRRIIASTLLACALLALLPAAQALARADRKKAIWGPVTRNGVPQAPIYRDLGAKIFEMGLPWAAAAPNPPADPGNPDDPAYRWPAEVDAAVAMAQQTGMRVALSLSTAPSWANGGHTSEWAPTDPAAFAAFAQAAAKRYPSVHLWQIWPEASRSEIFMPIIPERRGRPLTAAMKQAPHTYAAILDDSYAALKGVSARNLVIGGGTFTTGDISALNWLKNLRLADGQRPRMDLYGHNPFTNRMPDFRNPPLGNGFADFSDLKVLVRWVDRYLGRGGRNRKLKLFLAEFTAPTDHANFEFNFHVTRAVQAKWATAAYRIADRWSRIYALGWFSLYDDAPRPDGLQVNRGLITDGGQRKPSYYAYRKG